MANKGRSEQESERQGAGPAQESGGALEGAAGEDAGVVRWAGVEGGEQVAIDGGPPSAAGGAIGSPLPTREDEES
jgi:hypothetical protein